MMNDKPDEDIFNIGKIKCKGLFGGSITYNGYSFNVLKSAIQKYIRRDELDKAIYCGIELDLYSLVGDKGKAFRSNLINRLIVITCEEVSICNCMVALYINDLVNIWLANRNEYNSIAGQTSIIKIVSLLSGSRKCRIESDIKSAYFKSNRHIHIGFNYDILSKINEYTDEGNIGLYMLEEGVEELQEVVDHIIDCVNSKRMDVFYWINKFYNYKGLYKGWEDYDIKYEDDIKRRYRRKGSQWILWEILYEYILKNDKDEYRSLRKRLVDVYFEWYKKLKSENVLYLINAYLIFINDLDYNEDIDICEKILKDIKMEDVNKYYLINKENTKIEIDDYCVDMHCREGRDKGKTKKDFVKEGSYIKNEDKRFYDPKLREIYEKLSEMEYNEKINYKKMKDKNSKIVKKQVKNKLSKILEFNKDYLKDIIKYDFSDFKSKTLCMPVTCGGKVNCISCVYDGREYVLKEVNKDFNYGIDSLIVDECKELFGLKKIGLEIIKCDRIIRKKDKTNKYWNNNWKILEKESYYLKMNKFMDSKMLGELNDEDILKNEELLKEYIKIGLFRGMFRVTDYNKRNVLINDKMELLSIDEMILFKKSSVLGIMSKKYKTKLVYDNYKLIYDCVKEIKEVDNDDLVKILIKYLDEESMRKILEYKNNLLKDVLNELK